MIAATVAVLWLPPIAQDPTYHEFADRRGLLGIPNIFNVATNLAFLIVGGAGLALGVARWRAPGAYRAWSACFAGVALVCFGSAYYHLAPSNATLVWDRLPMSLALMALWVAVLSEHVHAKLERYLLIPALLLGLASVIYWRLADDLRPYILVQFLTLLTIPLILWLYPQPLDDRRFLMAALFLYVLAKLAEHFDHGLYRLTGESFSGHSLKHLLAALALFLVYVMLRRRFHPGRILRAE